MKNITPIFKDIMGTIKIITSDYKDKHLNDDYDRDEEGNIISCCGDIVDEDIMICPTCKENQ